MANKTIPSIKAKMNNLQLKTTVSKTAKGYQAVAIHGGIVYKAEGPSEGRAMDQVRQKVEDAFIHNQINTIR